MPPVPGTVVGGAIVPTDSADTYPVTDPQWGLGGCSFKATTTARNAISVPRLQKGMLVFVEADGNTYRLRNSWGGGPTTDADWEVAVGSGGAVTGIGNANSIAYWTSATALGSNIFFTRSPSTSIAFNNAGWTTDFSVAVERYIDPAGNDANDGLTPGTAWQTPGYALSQAALVGPGLYRIHCAPGTYSLVAISIPNNLQGLSQPQYGNSFIEFVGDGAVPGDVIFSNSGTIIYQSSPLTVVRFDNMRFEGNSGGVCITQTDGKIFFGNVEFDTWGRLSSTQGHGFIYFYASTIVITNTAEGFDAGGIDAGFILSGSSITMTHPAGALQVGSVFNVSAGAIYACFDSSQVILNGIGLGGAIIASECGISFLGEESNYEVTDGLGLFAIDKKSYLEIGNGTSVTISNCIQFFDIRGDSYFKDSDNTDWTIGVAPSLIILGNGSQIYSTSLVNGADPLISFVRYFPETGNRYAHDNRYTEKYCITMGGNLPPGYSINYITPLGVTATEYPLYIARGEARVVGIQVHTRLGNGSGQTDTYQVYVNGSAPSTPFGVTITNGTDASDFFGDVPLVAGDRVSVVFSSDAATTAEDITVQVTVRILE